MRLTSKGQVTIPIEVRKHLGLVPGESEVEFALEGSEVVLRRSKELSIEEQIEAMRGSATIKMTTDELLAMTRGED